MKSELFSRGQFGGRSEGDGAGGSWGSMQATLGGGACALGHSERALPECSRGGVRNG